MKATPLCATGLIIIAASTAAADQPALSASAHELLERYPGLRYYIEDGQIRSFYGRPITTGVDPIDTAEQFRLAESFAFDVAPQDLRPQSLIFDKRHTQPLMLDRDTGTYKFTAVYYTQYHGQIPVFRSDMRLLVRNEPGFPLVLAKSYLKPLAGFQTDGIIAANAYIDAVAQAKQQQPDLARAQFSQPELTIWAGYTETLAMPTLAIQFTGIDRDVPSSWLFLADAKTGAILYEENQIYDVDVSGNVSGQATEGTAADICEDQSFMPLPYAWVGIDGGNSTFADENGNFVIPNEGSTSVTVRSEIRGEWFQVISQQGAEEVLTFPVTPPGPLNVLHNPFNTEIPRAQVDGYIHHNVVRDYVLDTLPTYPVVADEEEFLVIVNKVGGICPNNAQYIASDPSTNFCLSSGNGPNMAWSVVIYHEYGHHLVQMGGSGQCQYGEGMADAIGVLVTDESGTGFGFLGDCNNPLRDADNNCQYSATSCTTNCGGPCHNCGRLLSGCVWSTRTYLLETNPADYRQIISDLTINSILLHSGSSISPQITIDFLTLDDDDGNLENGGPHYLQICDGFNDHGMQCPEVPLPIIQTQPDDASVCQGDMASFRVGANGEYTYQWFKNGLPIDGSTSETHVIPNAEEIDEGTYYCEVTNGSGTTVSTSANLGVVLESECNDGVVCTFDACNQGVCENSFAAPDSSAAGSRSVVVTPAACDEEVALLLTSNDLPCLSMYIDVDGSLTPTPVFQNPDTWSTVTIRATEIIPNTTYRIQSESNVGVLSTEALVTTWLWGDVNDNQTVNFEDVLLIVNVFQGDTSDASVEAADLEPCLPNGLANLADVQRGIQAFQLLTYEETNCPIPCP